MSQFAVLYDPKANSWLRFKDPVEELEVHDLNEVLPALQHLENRVEREGLHAAGFVSYEASPAFDEALQTLPATEVPLLHFGLFNTPEKIVLPAPQRQQEELNWHTEMTANAFADKIAKVQTAIAHGETYQVNLTFPLLGNTAEDPWQLFLRLVQGQKPENCGYLQSERWAICSASPELFFSREDSRLTMRPMKGTAPRGRTLEEDQQRAEGLHNSAKNRAENIMILDMVRNDLGRIAPPGGVHTEAICTLEKYPTVWQLTSTATANSNASLVDIFKALFPCASITGAPKARTMQIISETENCPRDIYTGAFGWMGPNRKAFFNVAIRTALVDRPKKQAKYGIGAGITWDSKSSDEYQECLDKAAILSNNYMPFALIETLRWTPQHGYFLLDEHLARLQASAIYFDFNFKRQAILGYLQSRAKDFSSNPQRVRLLLHGDGSLEVSFQALQYLQKVPAVIRFAEEAVNSNDRFLFHKTTRRGLYEKSLANAKDADEVILWNERGEITEGCTTNIVIERNGELITPPLSCGLLPGTYRDYLLKKKVIKEAVIRKEELSDGTKIYLINAVRKWRRAVLAATGDCS